MFRSLFTGRRRVGAGWVFRIRIGAGRYAGFTCACGAGTEYPAWRQAVRAAKAHQRGHPWPDDAGRVAWTPRRRVGRWLAAAAFVLALATVAFAATVASLAGLAGPAPAVPTVTTTAGPAYVPSPAGPPATSRTGGGR
jgi:hypothetical protein